MGFGAAVTVLDVNPNRLAYLDDIFRGELATLYATEKNIQTVVEESDLIIGAVLIPGTQAPHLIRREHLKTMKKRSVIVDVAVDQGGCVETTRPTTHDDPTFEVDGVVHYCVANMPGAVALTSTLALTSSTLPYGLKIADMGLEEALQEEPRPQGGPQPLRGQVPYPGVAKAFGLAYVSPDTLL